jgi:serine/threonine protein kinase
VSFVGSTIGNIHIESRLGTGGMGEVYLGYDPRLERRVAVKTIRPEHRLSGRVKARFLREARLLSKIGHPGICQVYDLIETPAADFLVLEYVEGRTLREVFSEEVSFEEKLRLAEKIAIALGAAHQEKIVHRDLKADNVMVTPAGGIKVLDFGIARSLSERPRAPIVADPDDALEDADEGETHPIHLQGAWPGLGSSIKKLFEEPEDLTRLGMVVGTITAMSPEQARGGKITEASDLYSLGILLQELFTGAAAYEGRGTDELLPRVTRAETRPIDGLDPDLTVLIRDLQNLDPRRRPTAEETAGRLREVLDKPQQLRRRRLRAAAIAVSFVLLLTVLAVVSWLAVEAEGARQEADRRREQAEGLIGFMIGDLQPKLTEVGRLDLMNTVADRALAYFDEVPESQLTDQEMARRVEAIVQIGVVRREQGDLPAAQAALHRAKSLATRLAERNPDNEAWQENLWTASSWTGQVLFDQSKPQEALTEWERTVEIARAQLARHPDKPVWLNLLSLAHHNVGTALETRGDLAGALASYRESLALKRKLSAAKPDDLQLQAELSGTLAWVSNVLERQGNLAGALAERKTHVEIQERLAARNPADKSRREDLASARGFLAGLLLALGDRPGARELYEAGLATIEELTALDPDNTAWQRWLGSFRGALGRTAAEEGESERALTELRAARRIFETLTAKDATNSDWRLQLGLTLSRTAAALEPGDPRQARALARQALGILRPLLEQEPDENTRGFVADAEVVLGWSEADLGDSGAARAAWERALAVLAPAPRPLTNWKLLDPQARALLSLGRIEEARPLVERARRMGYQGKNLLDLALAAGL